MAFATQNRELGVDSILNDLIKTAGFSQLNSETSIGITKNNSRFTIEPGSQLEYSSSHYSNIDSLINEFFDLLQIYQKLHDKLNIQWLDISLFPLGTANEVPLLPVPYI